jgi:predicted DNA-binding transcriptional regulator AlpA
MNFAQSQSPSPAALPSCLVRLSPWVNERLPAIEELLTARDVARLTRRPRWELFGLTLIGKFPRKKRYRGRPIGWSRAEVLDWMTRDLSIETGAQERLDTPHSSAGQPDRQTWLPSECGARCTRASEYSEAGSFAKPVGTALRRR